MGYRLQTIFLNGHDALAEKIRATWPEAHSKRVKAPFADWAIALPTSQQGDARDEVSGEDAMADDRPEEDPRQRIVRWSRRVPSRVVVFIDADCFGDNCLYTGYACRDGELLCEEPLARRGLGAVRRLVTALGIKLSADEYFAPLTRGYFEG